MKEDDRIAEELFDRALKPGTDYKKARFVRLRKAYLKTYQEELDRQDLRLDVERNGMTLRNRLRLTAEYLEDNPQVLRTIGLLGLAVVAAFTVYEIRETAAAVTETFNRFGDILSSAVSIDVKESKSLGGIGPSLPDIPATLSDHAQKVGHAKETFTNQVGVTFEHTRNAALGFVGTRIGVKLSFKI